MCGCWIKTWERWYQQNQTQKSQRKDGQTTMAATEKVTTKAEPPPTTENQKADPPTTGNEKADPQDQVLGDGVLVESPTP